MPVPPKAMRCFIDTNIWLYAFIATNDTGKREVAKKVINADDIVISTQVINETCVNMLKKAVFSEIQIRELVSAFYEKYEVRTITCHTLQQASKLREGYSLSYWDSLIIANALDAKCEILYSEDMQDGLKIAGQLMIINPFVD